MVKVKRDKAVIYIFILIVLLWTCLPSSINQMFGISVSNTMFRFNLWAAAVLLLIALLIQKKLFVTKNDTIYLLIIVISFLNASVRVFLSTEYCMSSVVESAFVMLVPFLMVKMLITIPSMELRWKFFDGVVLAGIFVALQVLLFGSLGSIMGWTSDYSEQRAFTTMGQATVTADFLFVILVLSFVLLQIKQKKRYGFVVMLMAISIVALQTRAAILLTVLFGIYVIWSETPKKMVRYFCLVVAVIVVSYMMFPEAYEAVYNRFFTSSSSGSNKERIELMMAGLEYFQERPIFGGGMGLALYRVSRVERYAMDIGNTHNHWIALLAEHGIIGTMLFIAFLWNTFKKYDSNDKVCKLCKVGFLEVALLCTLFETIVTTDIRATLIFWLFPVLIDTCYKSRITREKYIGGKE